MGDRDRRWLLAAAQNRVGRIQEKLGRLQDAEASHRNSLGLYGQLDLGSSTPGDKLRLAGTHLDLGTLLFKRGRNEEAENHLRVALRVQEELLPSDSDPRDRRYQLVLYSPFLSKCHFELGVLLAATGRPKEAEDNYLEALSLLREVSGTRQSPEDPISLADGLLESKIHYYLGDLFRTTDRIMRAENAYREAQASLDQLAKRYSNNPGYREVLAENLNDFASFLNDTGRAQEAVVTRRKALELAKALVHEFPSSFSYKSKLASYYYNLAHHLSGNSADQEAEDAYRQALAIQKQLATDVPT